MKVKGKVALSALLIIALCVSLIAGTTFALFTSESNVNIAVTSGKVNVAAEIIEGKHSSMLGGSAQGKVEVVDNEVSLNGIMPGDVFNFTINVTDTSTVKAKYRTSYAVENGYLLASGLDITLGSVQGKYKSYASAWEDQIDDQINVTIALPNHADSKIDNLYQGLSADISFAVGAIQANGVTGESEAEVELLPDYTALAAAFLSNPDSVAIVDDSSKLVDSIVAADYVVVAKPMEMDGIANVTASKTVDLNGYEITATLTKGRLFNFAESGAELTITNGSFVIPEDNTVCYGFVNISVENSTLRMENVNMQGHTDDGAFIKIAGSGSSVTLNNVSAISDGRVVSSFNTVSNVTLNVNGGQYDLIGENNIVGFVLRSVGSVSTLNGAVINSDGRLGVETYSGQTILNNCIIGNPVNAASGYGHLASAVSAANGASVTVNGGEYKAKIAVYVFNSGATITLNGGKFVGTQYSVRVEAEEGKEGKVIINDMSQCSFEGGWFIANERCSIVDGDGNALTFPAE